MNEEQEESIRLIEMYKNYPFLWDPKNKAHHNRAKREDAWKEMSHSLQKPVTALKSKIKSLMGSYRSEKSRENKSRITGSGSEDVYESKWFTYKYLQFLKDKDKPVATLDTVRSDKSQDVSTASQLEVERLSTTSQLEIERVTDESQFETERRTTEFQLETERRSTSKDRFRTSTVQEGRKRKKQEISVSDKMMSQALQILESSTTASNDPYFTYALHLSNELKKYDTQTLANVKIAIANILYEADMGRMSTCSYGSTPYL